MLPIYSKVDMLTYPYIIRVRALLSGQSYERAAYVKVHLPLFLPKTPRRLCLSPIKGGIIIVLNANINCHGTRKKGGFLTEKERA